MIRSAGIEDGAAICSIYNYYIENTAITFEEEALPVSAMEERLRGIRAKYPFLVWEEGSSPGRGEINGYAYAGRWKERSAYRYSAELSLYVRNGFQGRGIGRGLLERLLEELRKTGIHQAVSGIALPNERSVALHEKLGFKKAALFKEIGRKFNEWHDVGYWQLPLKKELS